MQENNAINLYGKRNYSRQEELMESPVNRVIHGAGYLRPVPASGAAGPAWRWLAGFGNWLKCMATRWN